MEAGARVIGAASPSADAIVGNPPFPGNKKMPGEPGEESVIRMPCLLNRGLPGGADLVAYWFEQAHGRSER